ncbi:unnamed protein product [Pleuronectes platessa]|uniref:Uncharacterized protein n=1 Tax=Pleuronectes platessa TaxID=8262 RepID=A0A9N7TU34_PLEPL|nr:unnamed protein product [Pleuronectes platessa]
MGFEPGHQHGSNHQAARKSSAARLHKQRGATGAGEGASRSPPPPASSSSRSPSAPLSRDLDGIEPPAGHHTEDRFYFYPVDESVSSHGGTSRTDHQQHVSSLDRHNTSISVFTSPLCSSGGVQVLYQSPNPLIPVVCQCLWEQETSDIKHLWRPAAASGLTRVTEAGRGVGGGAA